MELIGRSIRTYVADRSNLEAASDMLAGSLFAGIAFSWARLGNIHAMSHPVSAFFNVPHGVANGILFPYRNVSLSFQKECWNRQSVN